MQVHGWRSRGYLPHCDERGLVQHVIFGLADALPSSGVPNAITDPTSRAEWADKEFDRACGARLLQCAANAEIVEQSLLHGDGDRYALAAWCVMPTHVHVVMEQLPEISLAKIVHSWKSSAAHRINEAERREGAVWRREYFDRFMRSPQQFERTVDYVENNPVAAGLVDLAVDWPFSSAHWRRR